MEFKCNVFKYFDNIELALEVFLLWFKPRRYWIKYFNDFYKAKVLMFNRPVKIINGNVQAQADLSFWWKFPVSILSMEEEYSEAQRIIFQQNRCIPREIWPKEWVSQNYTSIHPH